MAGGVAIAASLAGSATASAAAVISTVTVDQADLVEDRPFSVAFTGTVDADQAPGAAVFVAINASGRGCAPTYVENEPNATKHAAFFVSGAAVSGALTFTSDDPGVFALCTYLDDVETPGSRPLAKGPDGILQVREPRSTLSLALASRRFEPGAVAELSWAATTEVVRGFAVELNGSRQACGPNAWSNEGTPWLAGEGIMGGPVSGVEAVTMPDRIGTYRLCGYVHEHRTSERSTLVTGDLVIGVGTEPVLLQPSPLVFDETPPTCTVARRTLRRGARFAVRCTGVQGQLRITAKRAGFQRTRAVTIDEGRGSFKTTGRFPRGRYVLVIRSGSTVVSRVQVRLR